MTTRGELKAGWPSLIFMDLPTLDLHIAALAAYVPPRGQRRRHTAQLRKLCQIRNRKRKRAMRR